MDPTHPHHNEFSSTMNEIDRMADAGQGFVHQRARSDFGDDTPGMLPPAATPLAPSPGLVDQVKSALEGAWDKVSSGTPTWVNAQTVTAVALGGAATYWYVKKGHKLLKRVRRSY
jgi:hypothetical protein